MKPWQRATAVSAALLALFGVGGCGGSGSNSSNSPTSPSKPFLSTWSIDCPSTTLTSIGQTTQCRATAMFSDYSTQDQTSLATWSSADSSIASISNSGLVTAKSNGSSRITGSYQGSVGSLTITVNVPLTMTTYSGHVTYTPYSYIGYHITGYIDVTLNRGFDSPVPSRIRAEWTNSMVGGSITNYHQGDTQLHFEIDQDTVARPNFSNSPTDYLRLIDVDRQVILVSGKWVWQ